MYRHNNILLGVRLLLCPFSRIIVVGSPPAPVSSHRFLTQKCGARYGFHLMEQDLYPVRKWFVAPIMSLPDLLLLFERFTAGKINDYFSVPVAFIVPSGIMKAN